MSDAQIFNNSELKECLEDKSIGFPEISPLSEHDEPMPYFIRRWCLWNQDLLDEAIWSEESPEGQEDLQLQDLQGSAKPQCRLRTFFWWRSAVSWITSSMTQLQIGTFRLHSSRIQAAIDSFRWHLKCIPAEFFSYRTTFRQRSTCLRSAFWIYTRRSRGIRAGFEVACYFDSPRMRSECLEFCWNAVRIFRKQPECCWNTLPMPFDISPLRMHLESFEHVQNIPVSHKNVPEYLECKQNALRIFKMQFNCPRMYNEVSFRQHSDSFRH